MVPYHHLTKLFCFYNFFVTVETASWANVVWLSSLINTLINRKNYARTSSQPGKTQTLNFYKIEDELARSVHAAHRLMRSHPAILAVFQNMFRSFFPIFLDLFSKLIEFLHYYNLPILVVGTKIDKIARGKWNKSESIIRKKLRLRKEDKVILFSAVTKTGKEQIWEWIDETFA